MKTKQDRVSIVSSSAPIVKGNYYRDKQMSCWRQKEVDRRWRIEKSSPSESSRPAQFTWGKKVK